MLEFSVAVFNDPTEQEAWSKVTRNDSCEIAWMKILGFCIDSGMKPRGSEPTTLHTVMRFLKELRDNANLPSVS